MTVFCLIKDPAHFKFEAKKNLIIEGRDVNESSFSSPVRRSLWLSIPRSFPHTHKPLTARRLPLRPVRRQEKRARRNFPVRFDVPFIGAMESIGLIQWDPSFLLGGTGSEEAERGGEGGRQKKEDGGIERQGEKGRRKAQARCQRIHPSRPPILILAPPANRASGQSEITLSPSRCVQSKLQFKSSCQTLFPLSPFRSPSLRLFSLPSEGRGGSRN